LTSVSSIFIERLQQKFYTGASRPIHFSDAEDNYKNKEEKQHSYRSTSHEIE